MSLNICPSLFYIVPDKNTKPYNENDIFMSDRFKILQAENLTQVEEIAANTGTEQALQVRLLCCYRMKDLPQSYCTHRHIENPQKQICTQEYGIQTSFIHFHVKMKNLYDDEYFLAFIEGADLHENSGLLVEELLCTIAWLEIPAQQIYLNIFTIGEPVFPTRTLSYLDEHIDSVKEKVKDRHQRNIECDITHINKKDKNRLSVFLENEHLLFRAS